MRQEYTLCVREWCELVRSGKGVGDEVWDVTGGKVMGDLGLNSNKMKSFVFWLTFWKKVWKLGAMTCACGLTYLESWGGRILLGRRDGDQPGLSRKTLSLKKMTRGSDEKWLGLLSPQATVSGAEDSALFQAFTPKLCSFVRAGVEGSSLEAVCRLSPVLTWL